MPLHQGAAVEKRELAEMSVLFSRICCLYVCFKADILRVYCVFIIYMSPLMITLAGFGTMNGG